MNRVADAAVHITGQVTAWVPPDTVPVGIWDKNRDGVSGGDRYAPSGWRKIYSVRGMQQL